VNDSSQVKTWRLQASGTCSVRLSGARLFSALIISLSCTMAKATVTQGAPESTQAGRLTSSWSSWCLVFLAGDAAALRTGAGLPAADRLCTRSMVAMGTELEGTGTFSASILSSERRDEEFTEKEEEKKKKKKKKKKTHLSPHPLQSDTG